jgi:prepilin-type N-terminal cleavage/methylation domain-containing protein
MCFIRFRRAGFTLVELLVVIAIIGILIAMLLPAVQAAREAGRRTQCKNNLRQLALAAHTYHDANGHLPTSISPWSGETTPGSTPWFTGKGWILTIMPQMEQTGLWSQAKPFAETGHFFSNQGVRDPNPVMRGIAKTILPFLQCPSDGLSKRISTTEFQWEGIEVAVTNYKGVIGDTRMGGAGSAFPGTEPDTHNRPNCNGVFFRNSFANKIVMGRITDGTAHTFMIGEDIPFHNYHSAWLYANGDYCSCHAPPNYFPRPPNPGYWPNAMGFRSHHPTGLQFSMADASVQFVKATINHNLYRALCTRHGGEAATLP